VEGLLNGIIIHNYARDAMIPLRKGQEFNFVIIRIKQHILDKYFKSIADNLHKLLFVGKPVLFYENLNPDILTVLNSVGQIQLNRPISRHLIFSKTLSLLAHTYDSLLIRKKESTSIVRMPGYEKVINARNYIMSDWQKPPTIKRLSRFMGMSQTNAKILFKQVFGNTIYQYFKKKKMEIAYQMIKDTDSDMVEISKHLGYRNPSQFSADFKNHYGILPKKFSMQINKDTSDGSF
jgi:AraC-like DNA-binding protein